jgi:hypothetical protein
MYLLKGIITRNKNQFKGNAGSVIKMAVKAGRGIRPMKQLQLAPA